MKQLFVILFILICIVAFPILYRTSESSTTFTVTDKTTKLSESSKNHIKEKYLIFSDEETFEITDTLLFFRWDSSDLYGQLKIGKTYKCSAAGWRIPFFSFYRNLIDCQNLDKTIERI